MHSDLTFQSSISLYSMILIHCCSTDFASSTASATTSTIASWPVVRPERSLKILQPLWCTKYFHNSIMRSIKKMENIRSLQVSKRTELATSAARLIVYSFKKWAIAGSTDWDLELLELKPEPFKSGLIINTDHISTRDDGIWYPSDTDALRSTLAWECFVSRNLNGRRHWPLDFRYELYCYFLTWIGPSP